MIFSVCGCGTIKVTLSQKAQNTITLPNLQGLYEESATVNGRSSWISTNKLYAIWYHPDFKDWMMGLSKEIGTRWLVHFSLASLRASKQISGIIGFKREIKFAFHKLKSL